MERIDFKTGFKCNNRCVFCVQGNKRKEIGNYSFDRLSLCLKEARNYSSSIVFTGGETTIHPDFLRLVSEAKKLGFKNIQIQTNGRMFCQKSFVQRTLEAGANEFNPSLHGFDAVTHDTLTDAPGSFEQVILGIQYLKSLNQRVITNSVVTKSNYQTLIDLTKLLHNLRVDQIQFAYIHILGTAAQNYEKLVPQKSVAIPYIHAALDYARVNALPAYTEAIPFCFMENYEMNVVEEQIPVTKIYDENVIENYTEYRLKEGKNKGPNCNICLYNSRCEGPWREYPSIFGWDEFKPVLK